MSDSKASYFGDNEDWRWHRENGLGRVINVSGTMTGLGASRAHPQVAAATADSMGHFVRMHELQAKASATIAALTGAEAGCMTASASAGISLCVAGCITGLDPARVEALPRHPGPKSEIVVQAGHLCGYGAPISTAIELAGGTVRQIGQSTLAMDHQLRGALGPDTAAALYVVSHHVVHYGQIPFARFVEICHGAGVPVIVDAASEYDLRGFIAQGADLAVYSAHKFLGGPTAGIIAGRRDLVRAAYLQNIGIGRGMKIGKESIAGAIRAMERWMTRDHAAIRAEERAALASRQKYKPPEVDDEPEVEAAALSQGVTSASVGKSATQKRGINPGRTTIIGIIGAGKASRALIRLRNGKIVTVRLGDRIDGGTINSIGDGRITYVKSGRTHELRMLDGR